MATAVQRFTKAVQRLVKPAAPVRRLPSVITMDLAPGQFLPLGHDAPPPKAPKGFSPPKFSPEEQAANPGKPMTRVIKDVLSVGKRKAGFDEKGQPFFWDVTPQDLQLIAVSFSNAQRNGVAFNLTKSHGDPRTCMVPTDDIISALDEVIVEDGVLWVSSYVTPSVAMQLQNPAMKVSPGIKPDFMDGEGHVYPLQLYHVAVVDQPVVPRQGPFMTLANSQNGAIQMDETILGWFKQIFEYEGSPLPESVTPENAADILPVLIEQLIGSDVEEEETEEAPTEAPAGEVTDAPIEMGNAQAPAWAQALIASNKALQARIDQMQTGSKKQVFEAHVDGLAAARLLSNAQVVGWKAKAAAINYDTSIVDLAINGQAPVGKVPTLGRQARTLANPQAEGVVPMSEDDVKKAAAELIGGKQRKRKSMAHTS